MITEYSKQHWIDEAYETKNVSDVEYSWDEENQCLIETIVSRTEQCVKENIDERSIHALYDKTPREWRKFICKHYLANDLLDKLEQFEGVANLIAFVDILTLLSYGMAQTAHDVLSATAVPSELDELKTWLLDALNTIAQD